MGYTHYYNLSTTEDLMIKEIGDDIRSLIANTDIPIVNGMGEPGTEPIITSEEIILNGAEPDDFETFVYPPGRIIDYGDSFPMSGFCKTGRRPYDAVVAAAHLSIKFHMGDQANIRSDGYPDEEEWVVAKDLFESTFPDRDAESLMPR